mgnify:CR=1 FL=1
MIIVTAAVIKNKNNKILITQRKKTSHNALKWEFPGGTLEPDESPEQCIIREIKEELNINIGVIDILKVIYHKYKEKTVMLLVYECKYISGKLEKIECNDAKWVNPEEFLKFDFAEADLPAVEKIINSHKN